MYLIESASLEDVSVQMELDMANREGLSLEEYMERAADPRFAAYPEKLARKLFSSEIPELLRQAGISTAEEDEDLPPHLRTPDAWDTRFVLMATAANPHTPAAMLSVLAGTEHAPVVASNPATPSSVIQKLTAHPDLIVRRQAGKHPSLSGGVVQPRRTTQKQPPNSQRAEPRKERSNMSTGVPCAAGCGKYLTAETSLIRNMGPTCARNYLATLPDHDRAKFVAAYEAGEPLEGPVHPDVQALLDAEAAATIKAERDTQIQTDIADALNPRPSSEEVKAVLAEIDPADFGLTPEAHVEIWDENKPNSALDDPNTLRETLDFIVTGNEWAGRKLVAAKLHPKSRRIELSWTASEDFEEDPDTGEIYGFPAGIEMWRVRAVRPAETLVRMASRFGSLEYLHEQAEIDRVVVDQRDIFDFDFNGWDQMPDEGWEAAMRDDVRGFWEAVYGELEYDEGRDLRRVKGGLCNGMTGRWVRENYGRSSYLALTEDGDEGRVVVLTDYPSNDSNGFDDVRSLMRFVQQELKDDGKWPVDE